MRVTITAFPDNKKIHAIKGLRAASGLGLKEAKDIIDKVDVGVPQELFLRGEDLTELDEYGVTYEADADRIATATLVEVLSEFPQHMTVGDVVAVLRTIQRVGS